MQLIDIEQVPHIQNLLATCPAKIFTCLSAATLGLLNLKGSHYAQVFMDIDATNTYHHISCDIVRN